MLAVLAGLYLARSVVIAQDGNGKVRLSGPSTFIVIEAGL